jgi:hypothetical protein
MEITDNESLAYLIATLSKTRLETDNMNLRLSGKPNLDKSCWKIFPRTQCVKCSPLTSDLNPELLTIDQPHRNLYMRQTCNYIKLYVYIKFLIMYEKVYKPHFFSRKTLDCFFTNQVQNIFATLNI